MQWHLLMLPVVLVTTGARKPVIADDNRNDHVLAEPKAHSQTLLHIHAIWRHGDRTPAITLPTDPLNNEASWQIGLGELTDIGIEQEYRLGQWLRQRYGHFLSSEFNPNEIYVRSSDFNRTLMSAQALLAGLYAKRNQQYYSSIDAHSRSISWRPIPVHSVARENDPMLCMSLACPVADDEQKRIFESEPVRAINDNNRKLFGYISAMINSSVTLANIWSVFDPLNVIDHHKRDRVFPNWMNMSIWHEIIKLYHISIRYQYSTCVMKRLRGGMLLKEILAELQTLPKTRLSSSRKFYGYSAHDATIAALLSLLGIQLEKFPPYAAIVLLETHIINEEFVLKLFYKNSTDSEQLYELPIAICCCQPCTLHALITSSRIYIPNNWKSECNNNVEWFQPVGAQNSGIVILLVIISVSFAAIAIISYKKLLEKHNLYADRMVIPTSETDSDLEVTLLDSATSPRSSSSYKMPLA